VEPLGEKPFDDLVGLTGPSDKALAVMDEATRAEAVSATRSCKVTIDFASNAPILGFSLQRRCSEEEPWPKPTTELAGTLTECATLVGKLRIAADQIPGKLAHNATVDRCPWVRCRNLRALLSHHRESAIVDELVPAALRDPHPAVRAWATTFAGGDDAFAELSRFSMDDEAPGGLRADALGYLVQKFPLARVRALIASAFASECEALCQRAIKAAAESGDAELVTALCNLAKDTYYEHRELIIRWLVDSGAPSVEPALLELIACRRPASALPALAAIGAIGTERSVGPLLELLSEEGLGSAARAALRQIQARTKTLDGGRLSIAAPAPEAGAVSMAGEAGDLALAPPDRKS
jgi:hypothetical protein